MFSNIPLENIVACDSFALFDENIIDWIISKIEDNMLDEKITSLHSPQPHPLTVACTNVKKPLWLSETHCKASNNWFYTYLHSDNIISYGLHKSQDNTYPDMRQEDFYETYVKPFRREDGRDGKVIVIISDGMRYECARELLDNLDLDEKCDAKFYLIPAIYLSCK